MKNFDKWNSTKKKINKQSRPPVKLGEIHWCSFGLNIGVGQDGRGDDFQRLVIIIKKFSSQIVLIAPLTTKIHKRDWYLNINIFNRESQIILNQVKPVDTKRLIEEVGQISEEKVIEILDNYIKLIKK